MSTKKKMPLRLERPLVIFDIESTGTNVKVDRIIDIAMLKIHPDGHTEELYFRVNPGIPIPKEATQVHHITDEDVKDAPLFSAVAGKIAAFIENCDLAGYNVTRYDIPMLEAEFARVGIPVDFASRNVVDAQRIYHQKVPRDLPAARHYYCGEMPLGAHSAMGDVQATWRVLQAQLEKYADLPRDVSGLSAYCNPRNPLSVDRKGKLRYDDQGEIVFAFGKYDRQRVRDVAQKDPSYIEYILDKVPPDTAEILRKALKSQGQHPEQAP